MHVSSKILLAIICLLSLPASASVMYTYTGNNFTDTHNSLPGHQQSTANNVTGHIVTAEALTYQGPYISNNVVVEGFSFSDGISTISNANVSSLSSNSVIGFQIDDFGEIVGWNITLSDNGWDSPQVGDLYRRISTFSSSAVSRDSGSLLYCTHIAGSCQAGQAALGWVNYSPGIWSSASVVSGVPVPATLWLLSTGLFALMPRRRKHLG